MGLVIGVLAALIVVFLLGYITVKKPVFGSVLISISLLFILISTFFYFQKDSRIENKKLRIPVDQIELSDVNYGFAYGNNYRLTAIIKNNSTRYRLQTVFLQISFLHCKGSDNSLEPVNSLESVNSLGSANAPEDCQLLEKRLHKVETRLPREKSTKIETYIQLDDALLQQKVGYIHWQVEIASGIAR